MCISAAMLKQVSHLKIVHAAIPKSSHAQGWLRAGDTQVLGDLDAHAVPQRNEGLVVCCCPPVGVDPSNAFGDVDIG